MTWDMGATRSEVRAGLRNLGVRLINRSKRLLAAAWPSSLGFCAGSGLPVENQCRPARGTVGTRFARRTERCIMTPGSTPFQTNCLSLVCHKDADHKQAQITTTTPKSRLGCGPRSAGVLWMTLGGFSQQSMEKLPPEYSSTNRITYIPSPPLLALSLPCVSPRPNLDN